MSQKITNPRTIQVTGGAIRAVTSDQVEASEKRLLARVRARWHEMISVASRYSSVPGGIPRRIGRK